MAATIQFLSSNASMPYTVHYSMGSGGFPTSIDCPACTAGMPIHVNNQLIGFATNATPASYQPDSYDDLLAPKPIPEEPAPFRRIHWK